MHDEHQLTHLLKAVEGLQEMVQGLAVGRSGLQIEAAQDHKDVTNLAEKYDEMQKQIARLDQTIRGNGDEGLKPRIKRSEEWIENREKQDEDQRKTILQWKVVVVGALLAALLSLALFWLRGGK